MTALGAADIARLLAQRVDKLVSTYCQPGAVKATMALRLGRRRGRKFVGVHYYWHQSGHMVRFLRRA